MSASRPHIRSQSIPSENWSAAPAFTAQDANGLLTGRSSAEDEGGQEQGERCGLNRHRVSSDWRAITAQITARPSEDRVDRLERRKMSETGEAHLGHKASSERFLGLLFDGLRIAGYSSLSLSITTVLLFGAVTPGKVDGEAAAGVGGFLALGRAVRPLEGSSLQDLRTSSYRTGPVARPGPPPGGLSVADGVEGGGRRRRSSSHASIASLITRLSSTIRCWRSISGGPPGSCFSTHGCIMLVRWPV